LSKIMLVNVTHVEESRVAVVDNGVLDAYEIETMNRTQVKGNIYNAVVENTHPSLEAAFLKISPEQNGFLPLDEVNFNLLPSRSDSRKGGRIGQHLKNGQRIMAQVVREPFAGKPPTVSTYFSLPGRFLVLMPGVDTAGVSRKIDDAEQRDRLKKIAKDLKLPDGFGIIVRTAGLGQTKAELQRDLRYLLRLWQSVQRGSQAGEFPGLVYREADLVIRTIRDHLNSDIGEVWIDNKETYEKALAFVRDVMPTRAKTLRLYTGDRPLFNKYNLEAQIESIYQRKVTLPSGGEIVIDGTEALTAVDVNSARSRRKGDAEETVVQTNVEAAAEIARQLRLRDLGGLVVVDFIDMAAAKNKKKVEDAMRAALKGDRARHDMTRISKMGLMEIARQRLKSAKMPAMYTDCPTCEGYGLIRNVDVAALAALRKLQTRSTRGDIERIRVALPPDVATWILNHKRDDLLQIEQRQNLRIDIEPHPRLKRHETEFETFARTTPVERPEPERAEAPSPEAPEAPPPEAPEAPEERQPEAATAEAPPKRKRRRRRRSKADRTAAESGDTAESAEPATVVPVEAAESTDEAAPADEPSEGGEAQPRRRRRRRRRSKNSGDESAESSPADAAAEAPPVVPPSVRADELMPAAVGGGRRANRSGATRRRRK
jgi:ribonuclease E